MKSFFDYLYTIVSSKLFKICLVLVILVVLVYPQFKKNKNKINTEQMSDVLVKIKENKRKPKQGAVVKKFIVADENVKTEENKEENKKESKEGDKEENKKDEEVEKDDGGIKNVTNIMLKFKLLEDTYQERLKNKQINYKKVSKYGDFVYYETKVLLNSEYAENPIMHFFMKLTKGDFVSEKLVGKKIGQIAIYTQREMFDGYVDPNDEEGKEMKARLDELDKQSEVVIPTTQIIYSVKIIDFIQDETIKKFSLNDNV